MNEGEEEEYAARTYQDQESIRKRVEDEAAVAVVRRNCICFI
jgi:hypothetical protein